MRGSEPMKAILRESPQAVSPVVAEILLVAISVVLAAVIYLMASGILGGHADIAPVVAFAPVDAFAPGTYNATIPIADASRALSINSYRFNLQVSGTWGNATGFAASGAAATVRVNGVTYQVVWRDVDGGSTLTGGDTVKVTGNNRSLPGATTFDLALLWTDGSQLTHAPWTTP